MKKLLTVSAFVLFAFSATAQGYNMLPSSVRGNGVIMPPSGSALVVNGGTTAACTTPQTVQQSFSGTMNVTCHSNAQPVAMTDAASLATLEPAAGGPRVMSDRNLVSDSSNGLRNDRALQ